MFFNYYPHSAEVDAGSQSLVDEGQPTFVMTEISGDQRYSHQDFSDKNRGRG